MKRTNILALLFSGIAMLLVASPAVALSKFNGSYPTTAYFVSARIVNNGACQSSPPASLNFLISDVKYRKKTKHAVGKVSFAGNPTEYRMTGNKMKGGIYLRFTVNASGYDFRYKFVITEVDRVSAHVHYIGATFYQNTSNGCAYNYEGNPSHSNY